VPSKFSREFSQLLYPTSICKALFVPRESKTAKIRGRKCEEERRHGLKLIIEFEISMI
jgi:hypothetical protein